MENLKETITKQVTRELAFLGALKETCEMPQLVDLRIIELNDFQELIEFEVLNAVCSYSEMRELANYIVESLGTAERDRHLTIYETGLLTAAEKALKNVTL